MTTNCKYLIAEFYHQFLSQNFDVKEHASQVLQGSIVSEQLAKLTEGMITSDSERWIIPYSNCCKLFLGLNLLDKTIHKQVSEHYEDLLKHASGIETLENVIVLMQSHIQVYICVYITTQI